MVRPLLLLLLLAGAAPPAAAGAFDALAPESRRSSPFVDGTPWSSPTGGRCWPASGAELPWPA
jgi:hypothetical protein